MKLTRFIAVLFMSTLATSGFGQQPALEDRIRSLFLLEHGVPISDLPVKLRQLGDESETAAVLMRLASTYRYAGEGSLGFKMVNGAVVSLGVLEVKSASELLSSLCTDRKVHEDVRALAARSLGQIDPESNKQILLRALAPSEHYLVRVYAAEGLAKTRDAEALKALERYSREEKDSYVRQQFEKTAQKLRTKGVIPN
jgi:hypothetical protein